MQDPGQLSSALAAAVGDDACLKAELRASFLEGAERLTDALSRARCDANWHAAARRLEGLAASFCATALLAAASHLAEGAPHDPVALRRVRAALVELHLAALG